MHAGTERGHDRPDTVRVAATGHARPARGTDRAPGTARAGGPADRTERADPADGPRPAGPIERIERIERVTDPAAVRPRIEELIDHAREDVLSLAPYTELSPGYLAWLRPLALRCLRRGVAFRTVMLCETLDDPATAAHLREIERYGARVRLIAHATERLLVCDARAALPLGEGPTIEHGALFTEEPAIVGSVRALFERAWAQATPLTPAPTPTDTARLILAAMCSGAKDETAARGIGVSVRTYRRRIAHLMDHLNAGSRAQAALLARDRGWI
ncbi:hypothetical protein ACFV5N_21930 [Streptomyces sp. NPDC059853]|uniref:hypothetical protein n=1 Tax=Streptomyces sp. NPDC059853 TaxID=3346973 RepID=UPI00365EB2C5